MDHGTSIKTSKNYFTLLCQMNKPQPPLCSSFYCFFFNKLIGTWRWCVIYSRKDTDSNQQVMTTPLIWSMVFGTVIQVIRNGEKPFFHATAKTFYFHVDLWMLKNMCHFQCSSDTRHMVNKNKRGGGWGGGGGLQMICESDPCMISIRNFQILMLQ